MDISVELKTRNNSQLERKAANCESNRARRSKSKVNTRARRMMLTIIPTADEIAAMSLHRCQRERVRLKNEIAFERGAETIGGIPALEKISACKSAIRAIEERLHELAKNGAFEAQCVV
jgi:hypothetical protein